jgi:hypothetical protein
LGVEVNAVMFAARFVAVVLKSVSNATELEVTVTPFTVTLSADPLDPVVKVTVPVALTPIGVRSLIIELFLVASIVNRCTSEAPAEWQY